MPTRILRTILSTYEVGKLLGQGGAGRVFKAIDEDGGQVAVKLLDSNVPTRKRLKRFVNEIRFGTITNHENVIPVIDSGVSTDFDSPTSFMVMPLCDGSLRDLMRLGLASQDILPLFSMILSGVEAAHEQKVIHRDLKPENILFTRRPDGSLQLFVADFGIAHFSEEDIYTDPKSLPGERLANFQYAAPEQRQRGKDVTERSDIYALGLILNELFTEEIPLGTDFRTIGSGSNEHEFLDAIVDRMIKQDPIERIGSIAEIRREIHVRADIAKSERESEKLRQIELQSAEVDDPILNDPIRIVDFDWTNGTLTLIFQQKVNPRWIESLKRMSSFESVPGARPENFAFDGDRAIVGAEFRRAQQIIDLFKRWLHAVQNIYRESLEREKREIETNKRKELEERIRREELNVTARRSLHI